MTVVVRNLPPGQRLTSLTSTLPLPSSSSRLVHGSGTQAPSTWPALKVSSVCELSCGRTCTSPPPSVVVLRPWDFSHLRRATSWVLPSCGDASFLPLRSAALLIDGFTTSPAPPDVAPAMSRTAWPLDFWKALIAGLGPT